MRRTTVRLVIFVLMFAVTACGQAGSENKVSSSTASTTTSPIEQREATTETNVVPPGYDSIITSDGKTRSYRVVDLATSFPAPLLFVLHGFGGTAEAMRSYSGFEEAIASSTTGGAIIVYPNGSGANEGLPQSWNAGDCCPFAIYDMVDDVGFFDELISKLSKEFQIDEGRVWAVGHSNGGMMSYRLACELSNRITAIGVAAGALTVSPCIPSKSVSAVHLHGELDAVVPIDGGEFGGIVFPGARSSFETFAKAGNCTTVGTSATCPDGNSVSLITNAGWTHDWQPEWTRLVVAFLNDLPRNR